jgi:hypothetical protein
MSNENEDFDLFATDVEDNLQETLAKGSYRWTNKYTAILAGLVVITASVSGGIWYGNKHAASSSSASLAGFASRIRGAAAAGGAFTGAAGAAAGGFGTGAAGAAAGGFGGAGAAGGFGGSRITGTVTKVNGTTLTITLDAAPATPVAPGDAVSVRDTGGAAATGATSSTGASNSAGTQTAPTTSSASGTKSGAATAAPSSKPSVGGAAAGKRAAGNGGGGRFSNPAFTACLAKNGVTFTAGTRPDRTDPKVAAAIQACVSTLGLPSGGGAGGPRPAPTTTP